MLNQTTMGIYNAALAVSLVLVFVLQRIAFVDGQIKINFYCPYRDNTWWKSILAALPMLILPAVQYGVGTDYFSYVKIFEENNFQKEFLFSFIVKLFNYLFGHPQTIFIFTSIVFVVLIFKHILDYSEYPVLSIIVFYATNLYFESFNVLRYSLAIAVCFYSIRYIENRQLLKFCLCIFVAVGFHYTALLFLPAYWLYGLNLSPWVGLFGTGIVVLCKTQIVSFLRYLVGFTPYAHYIGGSFDVGGSIGRFAPIIYLFVILFGFVFTDGGKRIRFYQNLLFVPLWLSLYSDVLFLTVRIRAYFQMGLVLYIPLMISFVSDKRIRVLMLVGAGVLYFVYECCCFQMMADRNDMKAIWGAYRTFFGMY